MIYENRAHFNGEPDWFPPLEEVERARTRMERARVPQSLRGLAAPPRIRPDETPWLWLAGAGLWVLIWPALIAAQLAGRWPALPWWLLPGCAILHMLVMAWPVLALVLARRPDALRRRFGQVQTLAQMLALEPDEFEAWTSLLFQLMGYHVRNTPDTGDHGIDLEVWNADVGRGLVQCKRYRGSVGEPAVRDLYGTLMAAHATRGWLVTTGAISRQARDWAAGKPIELLDGQALVALARRYR